MARQALARVLDPSALDRGAGPRGRLCIEVPAAWLGAGQQIEIRLPPKLTCARCDGGGCDGCGRSGALAVPASGRSQRLRLALPDRPSGAVVRLVRPLAGCDIEQLLVEVRVGACASRHVSRIGAPPAAAAGKPVGWLLVAALVAALAVMAWLLALRW